MKNPSNFIFTFAVIALVSYFGFLEIVIAFIACFVLEQSIETHQISKEILKELQKMNEDTKSEKKES